MMWNRCSALLVGVCGIAMGCMGIESSDGDGLVAVPPTYSIQGSARDSVTGKPAADVLVMIAGRSATTDVNGSFQMAAIPAGNQNLTMNLSGYEPFTRLVTLSGNTVVSGPLRRLAPYLLSYNVASDGSILVTFLDLQSIDAIGTTMRITGPGFSEVSTLTSAVRTVLSANTVRLQFNTRRIGIEGVTFFSFDGMGHQATFACGRSSPCTEQ